MDEKTGFEAIKHFCQESMQQKDLDAPKKEKTAIIEAAANEMMRFGDASKYWIGILWV